MKFSSCFLMLVILSGFLTQSAVAQGKQRIIRVGAPDLYHDGADTAPILELVWIKIGETKIDLNEPFAAPDGWLRDIRIRVRNVGEQPLSCVGIGFGLLETIDRKLETGESWGWALSLYRGSCGRDKSDWKLEKSEEFDLTIEDDTFIRDRIKSMQPPASYAKAVLFSDARFIVVGRADELQESSLILPSGTKFLDEEPY